MLLVPVVILKTFGLFHIGDSTGMTSLRQVFGDKTFCYLLPTRQPFQKTTVYVFPIEAR